MSEKYSTGELIDRICWKDDDRVLGPNDPYYPIGEETKNAIIARLRAADTLCEAAKIVSLEIASYDDVIICTKGDLEKLRKAIADYKGKK
jgi:hypothetical protein